MLEAGSLADGGLGEMGEPLGVAPLLVEAYVGLGRTDDAVELTRRYAEVTPSSAPARTTALVLRCQGLTAPDTAAAREAFEKALAGARRDAPTRSRGPAPGCSSAPASAATASGSPRASSCASPTTPSPGWSSPTGRTRPPPNSPPPAPPPAPAASAPRAAHLEETRVALLVAEGKSNKEVAAALFLSPKTIERHLGNVFRKRGFKSRTELARAYARPGSTGQRSETRPERPHLRSADMDRVNRLGAATSPYLLQHADNPVDWWEWEPAAFEEARRRNVPVLLSVGYAACHWCHVMAHESFEDEATAAYLNEHFVSIKVDREERPDVDAVYMDATTSMTGHGGWPMTCVLDHDGNPFFAGTYFPDQPRHGSPSFRQVLEALVDAWDNRGDDVRRVAGKLREHLARQTAHGRGRDHRGDAEQCGRAAARASTTGPTAGSAPRRSSRRRWCWSSSAAGVGGAGTAMRALGHPRGDGSRRHLRPARRRLRALLRRRVLGGAALREDALRQRPAARALRAGRGSTRRPDRPRDRRLHAPRAAAPARAGSPPRWTPTARESRASSTPGRRPSWSRCSARDDGAWAAAGARR